MLRLLVAAAVLAAALSGCAAKAGGFHAEATDPMVMAPATTAGFGYDGAGMVHTVGNLSIRVDPASDRGNVTADLTVTSGPLLGHYLVSWTDFHPQPGAAWQAGGIACGPGLVEHGASGHGNKMEPQVDLECGGWGTATAVKDGRPLLDPATGSPALNAHFMVTKEAVLQDGKVLKADRRTPFDPHDPGDGSVDASRMEAHLALWGQGAYRDGIAAVAAPSTTWLNDTATGLASPGPTYSKSVPVPVATAGARLQVHLERRTPGQVTVTLLDPHGERVGGVTNTGAGDQSNDQVGIALGEPGNYTLRVDVEGSQVEYRASATVTPPQPFLLHVIFQDVHVTA